MASTSERRQTIRIAVNGNLNVESVSAGQSLRLVDVGMGGFCVRSLVAVAARRRDELSIRDAGRKVVGHSSRADVCIAAP